MKLKGISEPQLRHVHCNHWRAGKDMCHHENLIWSSDPKWNLYFLLFNGRSSTQTFQWHHKWRLKLWRTVKQFTFTPTDSKQQHGMLAKAGCQEMKVSHLWQLETKYHHWQRKVVLFLCFFLEALEEKKLDYSNGNFNLKSIQSHFLINYSNHRKKSIISTQQSAARGTLCCEKCGLTAEH